MSIDILLTRYALNAAAAGYSDKTIDHTRRSVKAFADFLGGVDDVRTVTGDDFRRYLAALRNRNKLSGSRGETDRKLSGTAINTYARAIKAYWSWMEREKIIDNNPLAGVKTPKLPRTLPKILTESELRAVLQAAKRKARDLAMVLLLIDTGIRAGELCGLDLEDTSDGSIEITGKGEKTRINFFSPATVRALDLYVTSERPEPLYQNRLFLTEGGLPITVSRLGHIMVDIGKRAGLKRRLGPHLLRHCNATMLLKAGASLEHVRRSLGHSDSRVTEVYLHLVDSDLQQAHRKFSPVENLNGSGRGGNTGKHRNRHYRTNMTQEEADYWANQ